MKGDWVDLGRASYSGCLPIHPTSQHFLDFFLIPCLYNLALRKLAGRHSLGTARELREEPGAGSL